MPKKKLDGYALDDETRKLILETVSESYKTVNSLLECSKTIPVTNTPTDGFGFNRAQFKAIIPEILEGIMTSVITTGLPFKPHNSFGIFMVNVVAQRGVPKYKSSKDSQADVDKYRKLREENPLLYGEEFDIDYKEQKPFVITREADMTYPIFKWIKTVTANQTTFNYRFTLARANFRKSSSSAGYQPSITLLEYHREKGHLLYQTTRHTSKLIHTSAFEDYAAHVNVYN